MKETTAVANTTDPFGGLAGPQLDIIETETAELRSAIEKHASDIVAIGCRLKSIRDKLPHGAWTPWVETQLPNGFGIREAQHYISIAETALENPEVFDLAPADAVKALLAPSTPKALRNKVIEEIKEGKIPTAEEIKTRKKRISKPSPSVNVEETLPTEAPDQASEVLTENDNFAGNGAEEAEKPEAFESSVSETATGMRVVYYDVHTNAETGEPKVSTEAIAEREKKLRAYQDAVIDITAKIPDVGTVSAGEVNEHNLLELEAEQDYDALVKYHLGQLFRLFPELGPDWVDVEPYVNAVDGLMDQTCKAFGVTWDKSGRKHGMWRV